MIKTLTYLMIFSLLCCTSSSNNLNEQIIDVCEAEAETKTKIVQEIVQEKKQDKEQEESEEIIEMVEEADVIEEIPESKNYTDEDLYVLSHVIFGEAGGYSKELQIGVGSVVLNRVKDDRFPNTIKEVVFHKGQYACTWDGNYDREPDQQAIDVAIYLLENGSQYPEYVIFQSEFKQGNRTYKKVWNTYFCYWSKDIK